MSGARYPTRDHPEGIRMPRPKFGPDAFKKGRTRVTMEAR